MFRVMIDSIVSHPMTTFIADTIIGVAGVGVFLISCARPSRSAQKLDGYRSLTKGVDWIQRQIFHGSLLLSVGRVNDVLAKTGDLFLHDLEDVGENYVPTPAAWHSNFNRSFNQVKALGFDEPFIRTRNYYLKYCEAGCTTRNISVVQAVYTRPNNAPLAGPSVRQL